MPCWTAEPNRLLQCFAVLVCLVWVPVLAAETRSARVMQGYSAEPVWRDMAPPAALTAVPGTTAQWLYGTAEGQIYLLHQGSGRVQLLQDFQLPDYGDLGLSSIALHPAFRENGRLFFLTATDEPEPLAELTEWRFQRTGGTRPELVYRNRLLTVPASTVWCAGGRLEFTDAGHLQVALGNDDRTAKRAGVPGASLRSRPLHLDVDQPGPGVPFTRPDEEAGDGGDPNTGCAQHWEDGPIPVHDLLLSRVTRGPDGALYGYSEPMRQLLRLIPPEPLPLIPITTASVPD